MMVAQLLGADVVSIACWTHYTRSCSNRLSWPFHQARLYCRALRPLL